MVDDHDEALQRMRAADPALGSYPDQASLRRRLLDRTPLGRRSAGDAFDGTDADRAVRMNDGTTRGSRTTVAAAAAAAALAIAAGGYAVGAQTADDDTGGGPTVAATADDGAAERQAAEKRAEEGGVEALLGESDSAQDAEAAGGAGYGADSASSTYYPYGPTVLDAGPALSTEGGSGEVQVLRPIDMDPTEFLTGWADALGLEGEVTHVEELYAEFTAGEVYLSVNSGASTDFNYHNALADPYCTEMFEMDDGDPYDDAASTVARGDCLPLGDPPSEDEAIEQAQEFLATSGLSLERIEWSTETYEGDPQVNVIGSQDGQPTTFDVSVSAAGITSAYGSLGEYESLGDYPVLSPTEAVERTSDPRFAWASVWIPGKDEEVLLDDGEYLESEVPKPWDLAAGDPLPFPVNQATIVDATLDTGVLSLDDGSQLLVPAFDLVDEDGNHYPVLALADDALDFAP